MDWSIVAITVISAIGAVIVALIQRTRREVQQVHVLANNRLTKALDEIVRLRADLLDKDRTVTELKDNKLAEGKPTPVTIINDPDEPVDVEVVEPTKPRKGK